MRLLLALDTSTVSCSVALHNTDTAQCVYAAQLSLERAHSASLTQLIAQGLSFANTDARALAAVAIAAGPGSYTGLRIGASVAKGLCFAADVPLIAVPTLTCMALQAQNHAALHAPNMLLCPMIDARRMEVYSALFGQNLEEKIPTQAYIVEEGSFQEWLSEYPVLFFGDGSDKCRPVLQSPNAHFLPHIDPRAHEVGILALDKLRAQQFEDLAYFEPFYLKNFQAQKATKNKMLAT